MVSLLGTGIEIIISAKDRFSSVFKRATLSLKNFQASALSFIAVGAGIAIALGAAVKTSISFESAFAGVRKTVEATEAEFADLEKRFKTLSTETGTSFEELSKIGELAGQLGVSGVDNLDKFTRTIADIAVTTNLTTEAAATDFARIANVMQEPLDNIDRMGATIVALGNNFATTEADISSFAKRISGTGKIVGLTTSQVFAIGTAMSSVGVQAEAGGSAVQKALLQIDKSVIEGGEELEIFASTAGLTTDEFKDLWEKDAATAFRKFVEGLGKQGSQAALTLEDVKLGGIRTTRALLSLGNAGDLLERTLETSSTAWEENTALTEEAEKRYGTLEREIAKTKEKFRVLGDEIGDRITPFIRDFLLPALGKLIGFWESLSPQMQSAILIFAGVTAAVFLLAGAIALITLVASPWLLILLGIAIAITAIILLIKNWNLVISKFAKVFLKAAGLMDNAWETFKDGFIVALEVMKNITIIVWNSIIDFIGRKIQKAIDFINILIRAANRLPQINIPLIANVDLSSIKGQITDIGALSASLKTEREIRAAKFEGISNMVVVNIEKVEATDAESVADALEETLKDKINF